MNTAGADPLAAASSRSKVASPLHCRQPSAALFLPPILAVAFALSAGCTARRPVAEPTLAKTLAESVEPTALVRVYQARTAGWKSLCAVHCWIAVREQGANSFEVIEVMAFGRRRERTGTYVRIREREPELRYRGGKAALLQELQGDEAVRAIARIRAAVEAYPHAAHYRIFPGPNSNTFLSWLLRDVPELTVELPPTAIGKDWLVGSPLFARTESGTGAQLSVFGLVGLTLGAAEGVEWNLLGLTFGFDLLSPALKLPLLGRVGFPDRPVFWK